jgi:hypothetical protein
MSNDGTGNVLNNNVNREGVKKHYNSAKFTMNFDDLDLSKYTLKEDFDKHVKENNEEINKSSNPIIVNNLFAQIISIQNNLSV